MTANILGPLVQTMRILNQPCQVNFHVFSSCYPIHLRFQIERRFTGHFKRGLQVTSNIRLKIDFTWYNAFYNMSEFQYMNSINLFVDSLVHSPPSMISMIQFAFVRGFLHSLLRQLIWGTHENHKKWCIVNLRLWQFLFEVATIPVHNISLDLLHYWSEITYSRKWLMNGLHFIYLRWEKKTR